MILDKIRKMIPSTEWKNGVMFLEGDYSDGICLMINNFSYSLRIYENDMITVSIWIYDDGHVSYARLRYNLFYGLVSDTDMSQLEYTGIKSRAIHKNDTTIRTNHKK